MKKTELIKEKQAKRKQPQKVSPIAPVPPTELIYVPYAGGGGPTIEQSEMNTRCLGVTLKMLQVPFKEDMKYMEKLCGIKEVVLKITKGRKNIYVSYDRWGFCADGHPGDLDQASFTETLTAVVDWYFKK